MTKVTLGHYTVRVWATVNRPTMGPNKEITEALNNMYVSRRSASRPVGPDDISEVLDAFEDIAAYEILNPAGNGGLVYPDWK
jgi:hypothetical protein